MIRLPRYREHGLDHLRPQTTATGHWAPWTTANAVEPEIIIRGWPLPLDPTTMRPASVEASIRVSSGTPSSRRVVTVSRGRASFNDAQVRSRMSAAVRRSASWLTTGTESSPVQQITSIDAERLAAKSPANATADAARSEPSVPTTTRFRGGHRGRATIFHYDHGALCGAGHSERDRTQEGGKNRTSAS
jgi:hypothetical protein